MCKYEWCIHIYYINVTFVSIEHYSYLNFMHVLSSHVTSAIQGKERQNKFGKTGTTSPGNVNLLQPWSKLNDKSSFLCMGPSWIQPVSVNIQPQGSRTERQPSIVFPGAKPLSLGGNTITAQCSKCTLQCQVVGGRDVIFWLAGDWFVTVNLQCGCLPTKGVLCENEAFQSTSCPLETVRSLGPLFVFPKSKHCLSSLEWEDQELGLPCPQQTEMIPRKAD